MRENSSICLSFIKYGHIKSMVIIAGAENLIRPVQDRGEIGAAYASTSLPQALIISSRLMSGLIFKRAIF